MKQYLAMAVTAMSLMATPVMATSYSEGVLFGVSATTGSGNSSTVYRSHTVGQEAHSAGPSGSVDNYETRVREEANTVSNFGRFSAYSEVSQATDNLQSSVGREDGFGFSIASTEVEGKSVTVGHKSSFEAVAGGSVSEETSYRSKTEYDRDIQSADLFIFSKSFIKVE